MMHTDSMSFRRLALGAGALSLFVLAGFLATGRAFAHCDTLDGPVVLDARRALDSGDIAPVLKWVRSADEPAIRDAFAATRAVRGLNEAAARLADQYFFETLVRVHRAGEGAPYDGLKPAGSVPALITSADKALDTGSVEALAGDLSATVAGAVRQRHKAALDLKAHAGENPEAGRRYVAAYVEYVHLVEALHGVLGAAHHAAPEGGHPVEHRH